MAEQNERKQPRKVKYDLGFGHMGNGLTVWNRLHTVHGDYETIAHISPERVVTFYDRNMPDRVRRQIEEVARTSDMRVSATQDTPVFKTPPEPDAMSLDTDSESELLRGAGDRYGIYQIENTRDTKYAFRSYAEAAETISRSDYRLMYQAPLLPNTDLETLWEKHNRDDRPAAQEMRSMSMSDVVVLKRNGHLRAYYADRFGFEEINNFLDKGDAAILKSPLRATEMSTENNYNMIDGILNNANLDILNPKALDRTTIIDKPSVVERLSGSTMDVVRHNKEKQPTNKLERTPKGEREL